MPLALFYKPSYERLATQITAAAPNLKIALYDENANVTLDGNAVDLHELRPDYCWVNGELLISPRLNDYFEFMLNCESLSWVHTVNTGLDGLPYLDLIRKGVRVTNNHAQAISITEFIFGQLLAHLQPIATYQANQKQGVWKPKGFREIYGSRWTIVGFGHIGQEVAKRARAFGADITAVRRSMSTEGLADRVVGIEQLGDVLPQTDILVLACNVNDTTRGVMGEAQFEQMKSNGILINIARGDLVQESALQHALDNDQIGYAILDVFNQEPPAPESWVWQHPKVSLTPHTSFAGSGMRQRSTDIFIQNLQRVMNGEALVNEASEKDIV